MPPGELLQKIGHGMSPCFPALMLHDGLYRLLRSLLGGKARPFIKFGLKVVPGVLQVGPGLL